MTDVVSDDGSNKRVMREAVLAARAALPPDERARADAAILSAARDLVAGLVCVAAYAPLADEPGGSALPGQLAAVVAAEHRSGQTYGLLLPAMRPDRDLDWVRFDGTLGTGATLRILREPPGPRLGVAAITDAELVLVPALAVDATGARLGRGGGSYDRALTRVRRGVPIVALLYTGELVPAVATEPHDRPVTAVLTPDGLRQVG